MSYVTLNVTWHLYLSESFSPTLLVMLLDNDGLFLVFSKLVTSLALFLTLSYLLHAWGAIEVAGFERDLVNINKLDCYKKGHIKLFQIFFQLQFVVTL